MTRTQSLLKAAWIIAFVTVISKIIGFLRDIVIANYYGAGMVSDAYFYAYQIPALAISSTNIRKRVARGMSVRYLTSESVLGYIRKRRLYADLGQEDFE